MIRQRCFRCGLVRESSIHDTTAEHPEIRNNAHAFESHPLDALLERGGALVSSASCEVLEIADARQRGDFFVKDGFGYVLRTKEWLDRVHARDGYLQSGASADEAKG